MKRVTMAILVIVLVVIVAAIGVYAYQSYNAPKKTTLSVYAAGSLEAPFTQLAKSFESAYPNITVQLNFAGSVDLMREIQANGSADVFASADWTIIPQMYPTSASYDIGFATNQIALVYNNQTLSDLGITSINQSNWYQILQNPNVKFGFSDGNQDPSGYDALMVMVLSNMYYGQDIFQSLVGNNSNIQLVQNGTQYYVQLPSTTALQINTNKILMEPNEDDLLPYLESNTVQFIFTYKSAAIQNGLPYVQLPPQINLASTNSTIIANYYDNVSVYLGYGSSSQTLQPCRTIVYGVTIPTTGHNSQAAALFIKYLLETNGQNIMTSNGQAPIYPGYVDNLSNVPSSLLGDVTTTGPKP